MKWFIGRNGQQSGPFSEEQIRNMLQQGLLSPQDLFWHEGLPNWDPLSSLPEPQVSGVGTSPAPQSQSAAPGGSSTTAETPMTLLVIGYVSSTIAVFFLPIIFGPVAIGTAFVVKNRGFVRNGNNLLLTASIATTVGFLFGIIANL